MKTNITSALAALLLFIAFGSPAVAGGPMLFLKIGTIQGDSTVVGHEGEINVLSFGEKIVQQSLTQFSAAGRANPASAQFTPITIVKDLDKSSPALMLACALGTSYPKATLTMALAGNEGRPLDLFTLELTNVFIASYNIGSNSGGDELPTETLTLNFSAIKWTYRQQKPDGSLGDAITGGFDLRSNRPLLLPAVQ